MKKLYHHEEIRSRFQTTVDYDKIYQITIERNPKMSFQAYLDNVEKITGKTPREFIKMAEEKNLTQYKEIIDWLRPITD